MIDSIYSWSSRIPGYSRDFRAGPFFGLPGASPGLSLHQQGAIHHHPVTRKSANEGVIAFGCGGLEVDGEFFPRIDHISVNHHIAGFGDVVAGRRIGIGNEPIGQATHPLERSGREQRQIVRHPIGIVEGEGQILPGCRLL